MKLHDYLSLGHMTQSALAAALGITPVLISQWKCGVRPIPARRCPDIERATGGIVTCEELRPDVNWAVLRNGVGAEHIPAPDSP